MGRKGTKKGKNAQLKGNGTRREKRAAVNKKRTRRGARGAHRKPRRSIKQKRGGNPEDSPRRIQESVKKIEEIEKKLDGLLQQSYTLAGKTYYGIGILKLTQEEKKAIIDLEGNSAKIKESAREKIDNYNNLFFQLRGGIGMHALKVQVFAAGQRFHGQARSASVDPLGDSPIPRKIAYNMFMKKFTFLDEINGLLVTTSDSLDELKDKYTAELRELKELASPSQSPKEPSDDVIQSLAKENLQIYEEYSKSLEGLASFFDHEIKQEIRGLIDSLKDLQTLVLPSYVPRIEDTHVEPRGQDANIAYRDAADIPPYHEPRGQDVNIEDKS